MSILIISLTLSVILLIFYLLLTLRYKNYLEKVYDKKRNEEKIKRIEKFIPEMNKDLMSEKLEKISLIISETENHIDKVVKEKIKIAQQQLESKTEESETIEKGGREYRTLMAGLRSAFPKTKEELLKDIENLKDVMEKLEELEDYSKISELKKKDVGAGIFYEKMSRKFQEIINIYHLNEYRIIPLQRLKFHTFEEIKNIKNDDFLPILNLMKETNLLSDIIELNPTFYILSFEEEEFTYSNPEKVVLILAYEEEKLNIPKLLELTEWDYTYADKILNEMQDKEILSILNDDILVQGFGYPEERKKWNAKINEHIEREKLKEQEKLQKRLALKERLKEKIKEGKEQKLVVSKEKSRKEEDLKELEGLDNEVPKIKFESKPKVKSLPLSKEKSKVEKEDINNLDLELRETEENEIKELFSQRILSFHENFSLLNGGFVQYEKIKEYIEQDLENISEDLLKEVLKQLTDLKLIYSSTKIGKFTFYLFKDIALNPNERKFIRYIVKKVPMEKEDLMKGLKWGEGRTLKTMKKLQEKGILRIESNKIIIPGIIQKIKNNSL